MHGKKAFCVLVTINLRYSVFNGEKKLVQDSRVTKREGEGSTQKDEDKSRLMNERCQGNFF